LAGKELENLATQLSGWTVSNSHHLEKSYELPDFRTALAFVNRAGEVAEEQGHHPELGLGWGHVDVRIWTHKIDGLTESDFILAAKLDHLLAATGAP
jgi:4a-hydroxytetrahydrobiopterin dehydratase